MFTRPAIPFELHLTTHTFGIDQAIEFTDFCRQQESKPLLIELARGEYIQQPMLNKVVKCRSLQQALDIANFLSELLNTRHWRVQRLKIEIPANHAGDWDKSVNKFPCYFEWHGKIQGDPTHTLLQICEGHQAHLSINALKKEERYRFITLREYGDKEVFDQRVGAIGVALDSAGWPLIKEVSEYCVYDNNVYLDKGWLSN
ncbi:hypothetical protein [Paraflavitalea sp. CAU 1676]|uniref:hypothetical protein n=1 Tax=Paraflavitalea sp. CAU 1676 TaxID=3032598 RepID=UPI0023DC9188|nr:hypothetical protein [Paraflavitalea sp. CAU 1676]MDF2192763.1 hypothetical protein [Paraflavitalea sp. CAU 1676]